ncbi:hypothetical protein K9N68_29565 [Kovacikia minuta CCNUW1]|uniref:hypothetical protein n=1 Tax=Kovacikia minuta TaxID=2931930 RepID=UPI001CCE69D7|nr:hypothetical protein [Kovacikia minuta]UBF25663.1 hypothetical protein K9N68_29565 [Kovacikia minuta CCNUW1]
MQSIEYPEEPEQVSLLQPLTPEQISELMQILDEWIADESGYEEETWSKLVQSLNQQRKTVSARSLFH